VERHQKKEEAMNAQQTMVSAAAAEAEGKWLFRVGGISALVLGLGYVAIIPLYALVGAPPKDGEAWLKYLAGKSPVWWGILGLSVLTDVLFIPVALALYHALKGISRNAMLVAAAFVGLFVVLDLAVTWPNIAALITLSGKYAVAMSDAQRAAYVAAANYASAVVGSSLEGVYSIGILSLGILVAGLIMLRGVFGKITAYLSVLTGILGIVSVVGPLFMSALGVTVIITSVLTTIWVVLVGVRLFRLGGR
jgi:hypothetical protein